DRGLGLLPALSDPQERDRCEIELLLAKGGSLITIEGFASTNAGEAYRRAQLLTETRGDVEKLVIATFGLWNFTRTASFDRARAMSARMIALTRDLADDGLRLQAHHTGWTTGFFSGEPATGDAHAQEGRRLYHFERHRSHALLFGGHDPGVCARILGGWSSWL